ncbi:MAG: DUF1553 domain-containing protein [Planctomycetota bacterium]|nr:DUF1553 domain-containing protein [Planctomycetota bacterium]
MMPFCSTGLILAAFGLFPPSTWWADQPVVQPELPIVQNETWCRNEIDHFILARLEAEGLTPAGEADRRALIRRVTYNLTGIPPTPEAVEAFVVDDRPDAYEQLIESLLASPQYGVKWGRPWLDRVRWAETDGYERDRVKPAAWRYRDWVVDAFNNDMPYDRFITLQLAGDEVPDRDLSTMVATGFLHLGVRDDEPTDPETAIYDDLDGMLDTTCRATLAISMGCVRCHAHKRDPIPHADYYRMLSFFRGLKPYRLGYGNAVIPSHYVRHLPLDYGHEDDSAIELWIANRNKLRSDIESLAIKALGNQGGTGASPDLDTALGLPARGLVTHLDFEGDPEICEVGHRGHALLVRGVENAMTVPRPIQDDFTISVAFRPDADGPGDGEPRWFLGSGLVDGEISGVVDDLWISWFKNGRVTAGVGNPETFLASPPGLALGQWHVAALTRNRETGLVQLWVDGELVDEKTGGTQALTSPDVLAIGRMHPGGNPFHGAIDEVRIYDRVLSPHELLALHDSPGYSEAAKRLVDQRLDEDSVVRFNEIYEQRLELNRPVTETAEVLAAIEVGTEAPATHRLPRGNPHTPAEEVEPGIPEFLGGQSLPIQPTAHNDSTGRRLALANWIMDPENARTGRVLANRLWQHHFGRGIVRTPDDFGKLGLLPTHPELLDWLAMAVIEREWGMKDMHRLIMTSATYRMGSTPSPEVMQQDPMNDYFSRFDMRRLTAEELRDSLLTVNGTINMKLGGPSVYPPLPEEVLATASRPDQAWGNSSDEEASRRSLYIHIKRSLKMPLLESFDMADSDSACPVRFNTTVPTQALMMLNSDELNAQAARMANRLRADTDGEPETMIRRGLALATQRPAHEADVSTCLAMLSDLESEGLSREDAMHYTCLGMLNLNAFMYID